MSRSTARRACRSGARSCQVVAGAGWPVPHPGAADTQSRTRAGSSSSRQTSCQTASSSGSIATSRASPAELAMEAVAIRAATPVIAPPPPGMVAREAVAALPADQQTTQQVAQAGKPHAIAAAVLLELLRGRRKQRVIDNRRHRYGDIPIRVRGYLPPGPLGRGAMAARGVERRLPGNIPAPAEDRPGRRRQGFAARCGSSPGSTAPCRMGLGMAAAACSRRQTAARLRRSAPTQSKISRTTLGPDPRRSRSARPRRPRRGVT